MVDRPSFFRGHPFVTLIRSFSRLRIRSAAAAPIAKIFGHVAVSSGEFWRILASHSINSKKATKETKETKETKKTKDGNVVRIIHLIPYEMEIVFFVGFFFRVRKITFVLRSDVAHAKC